MKELLIAKKQELEAKRAEILNVNVDELIDEIDDIIVETAMAMEPVAQPVVESTPVDTVDTYEVPNEA